MMKTLLLIGLAATAFGQPKDVLGVEGLTWGMSIKEAQAILGDNAEIKLFPDFGIAPKLMPRLQIKTMTLGGVTGQGKVSAPYNSDTVCSVDFLPTLADDPTPGDAAYEAMVPALVKLYGPPTSEIGGASQSPSKTRMNRWEFPSTRILATWMSSEFKGKRQVTTFVSYSYVTKEGGACNDHATILKGIPKDVDGWQGLKWGMPIKEAQKIFVDKAETGPFPGNPVPIPQVVPWVRIKDMAFEDLKGPGLVEVPIDYATVCGVYFTPVIEPPTTKNKTEAYTAMVVALTKLYGPTTDVPKPPGANVTTYHLHRWFFPSTQVIAFWSESEVDGKSAGTLATGYFHYTKDGGVCNVNPPK